MVFILNKNRMHFFGKFKPLALNLLRAVSTRKKSYYGIQAVPQEYLTKLLTLSQEKSSRQKSSVLEKLIGKKTTTKKFTKEYSNVKIGYPLEHFKMIDLFLDGWELVYATQSDVINLFEMSYFDLYRNIEFLKECKAAKKCNPHVILDLDKIMNYSDGILFQTRLHMAENVKLLDMWMEIIPSCLRDEACGLLKVHGPHDVSCIAHLRNVLFACVLAEKWKIPFQEALNVIQKTIQHLPYSLNRLKNMLILLDVIGYDQKKILTHPDVLLGDPRSLKNFMSNFSSIQEEKAKNFLLNRPLLVSNMNFETLQLNMVYLQHFGIPIDTVWDNAEILLTYKPPSLLKKLKIYKSHPDFSVFSHHKNFPNLLKRIDLAADRLETILSVDDRLLTIKNCTNTVSLQVENRVCRSSVVMNEMMNFLIAHTGHSSTDIRDALNKHPHIDQLNILNTKKVIELLRKEQFNAYQIFEAISLILYPVHYIKEKLDTLYTMPEMQPISTKRRNRYFLRYLHYLVELDHDFTGNAVFGNYVKSKQKNSSKE